MNTTSEWSRYAIGDFPESPNQFQFYRTTFTLGRDEIDAWSSFYITAYFRYAIIIYVNGYEVYYRHISSTTLTDSSLAYDQYASDAYHTITVPTSLVNEGVIIRYLHEGENSIAVAIIAANTQRRESTFKLVMQMQLEMHASRLIDYTVTSSGLNEDDVKNILLHEYDSLLHCVNCGDPSFSISFLDDRREWFSAVKIVAASNDYGYEPISIVVEGKNPEDDTYTTLANEKNLVWWEKGQLKTIRFLSNRPYNTYRFSGFTGKNNEWMLRMLDLVQIRYKQQPHELDYGSIFEMYLHATSSAIYPKSDDFFSFTVNKKLPSGLVLDPVSGVIVGSADAVVDDEYLISATGWNAVKVRALLRIIVEKCENGHSLVSLRFRTDSSPNNLFTTISRNNDSLIIYAITKLLRSSSFQYIDLCLFDDLYTLTVGPLLSQPWSFPTGMTLLIEDRAYSLLTTSVSSERITYSFDLAAPIREAFSVFSVFSDEHGFSDLSWTSLDFSEEQWESTLLRDVITQSPITYYYRYHLTHVNTTLHHMLYLYMHYRGGIAAYFNSKPVYQQNLPTPFSSHSYSALYRNITDLSRVSILLEVLGCEEENILAFEVHRNIYDSASVPFLVTGWYAVETCSVIFQDYESIYGYSTNDYESAFNPVISEASMMMNINDNNHYTYSSATLSDSYYVIQYTINSNIVFNFNAYHVLVSPGVNGISWIIQAKQIHDKDWNTIIRENSTIVDNTPTYIRGDPFIKGYQMYRIVFSKTNSTRSFDVRFSELNPAYCYRNEPLCHGDEEYNSVHVGEISTGSCPVYYEGYSYKKCVAKDTWSSKNYDMCNYIKPRDITYSSSSYVVYFNRYFFINGPEYFGLVRSFEYSAFPPISSITISPTTASLSGTVDRLNISSVVLTIKGCNPSGCAYANITILLETIFCQQKNYLPRLPITSYYSVACKANSYIFGEEKWVCLYNKGEGLWIKLHGHCVSMLLGVLYGACFCIVVFMFICMSSKLIRLRFYRYRAIKKGNNLYKRLSI